jgi:hypothetical protein
MTLTKKKSPQRTTAATVGKDELEVIARRQQQGESEMVQRQRDTQGKRDGNES